ncbi:lytic transglycosylase, partial [Streptomyces sp. SP18CS02]|uniref:lytic transglycosylase n=1 Tax=Streptomyces sp. SP18CS02 TaxID=3002531 RepID=UPI002E775537
MSAFSTSGFSRLKKNKKKLSLAGVAAVGAAAIAFSAVPGNASTEIEPQAVSAAPVAFGTKTTNQLQVNLADQHSALALKAKADAAAKAKTEAAAKANAAAAAKVKAAAKAKAEAKAKADAAAKKRAAQKTAASRAATRTPVYANNLDGWIREALGIMKKNNIPGTYEGIHRNIMRESSGNPNAINNWDINAINGVPSIGLL